MSELTVLFGTWLAAHATPDQIDSYNAFYERNIAPALSRRSASNTAGALSAAQFEHEVTQQTQAYEFKEGPNGEWLFRCDEWFNLSAVLDDSAATALADAQARIEELERLVEQAFRDGLAYGGNVASADPDLAWHQSRARSTLNLTVNHDG